MRTSTFAFDYLVLGSGMAAATAAFAAREADPEGSICVVSEEVLPTYSKPMLTKSPLRTFSVDKFMVYRAEDFEKANIELLLDTRVEHGHRCEDGANDAWRHRLRQVHLCSGRL